MHPSPRGISTREDAICGNGSIALQTGLGVDTDWAGLMHKSVVRKYSLFLFTQQQFGHAFWTPKSEVPLLSNAARFGASRNGRLVPLRYQTH
jgi:hypothetical protein